MHSCSTPPPPHRRIHKLLLCGILLLQQIDVAPQMTAVQLQCCKFSFRLWSSTHRLKSSLGMSRSSHTLLYTPPKLCVGKLLILKPWLSQTTSWSGRKWVLVSCGYIGGIQLTRYYSYAAWRCNHTSKQHIDSLNSVSNKFSLCSTLKAT